MNNKRLELDTAKDEITSLHDCLKDELYRLENLSYIVPNQYRENIKNLFVKIEEVMYRRDK